MLFHDKKAFCVMGILNVTPDSFSDGGCFIEKDKALRHAFKMVEEGADIIDVGGESTRPGANPLSLNEELDRVLPVIEILSKESDVIVSIDTMKPEVMREAVKLGARMINDVNALEAPNALEVARDAKVDICLMHKKGLPKTMQSAPDYQDVIEEIKTYLEARIRSCLDVGISKDRLCLDPGFGFGKTLNHNMTIMKHLSEFLTLGFPLLLGTSRKTSLGEILQKEPKDRLYGGLALSTIGYLNGARLFRTHDVKETVDALKVAEAVCITG